MTNVNEKTTIEEWRALRTKTGVCPCPCERCQARRKAAS